MPIERLVGDLKLIKTEKELVRLIWKEMGLDGHNANLKRRSIAAKEVHKAVDYMRLHDE